MDRERTGAGTGTGFVSSRGSGRRGNAKITSGEEKTSFRISEDGLEFHYCQPDKMTANYDVKDYKSSLKFVGGYSVDSEQNFWNDKSSLSFLKTEYLPKDDSKEKTVHFDLNTAKETEKPFNGTLIKSSENFFSWITSNVENLTEILNYETSLFFLRNVFAKLLRIPYCYALDLDFHAVYLNGIVYLLNYKNRNQVSEVPELCRWGTKFKQYLTYGENVENGVECNRDYRCVMSAKLGSHNLLFSASVDCFNPDLCDFESPDPSSSVLLKSCYDKAINNKNFKRFRTYDWCASLASLNIPYVLVGFRNDDGILEVLKLYTEEDLRQQGKEYWDINIGFTFANEALSFIEKTTKTRPGTVFSFTKKNYTPHIKAEETDMENFPPKWFTEGLAEAGILPLG